MKKIMRQLQVFVGLISRLVVLVLVLFSTSCDTLEVISNTKPQSNFDTDVQGFSKLLASKLNDASLRAFIKSEAVSQFDGDYDILLAAVLDKEVNSPTSRAKTLTFRQALLSSSEPRSNSGRTNSNDDFLDSLIAKYPLLQISIPEVFEGSTEKWDTEEQELLVAYLPEDYDEFSTKVITAFDKEGLNHEVDAINEPSAPVIIISNNERLVAESDKGG